MNSWLGFLWLFSLGNRILTSVGCQETSWIRLREIHLQVRPSSINSSLKASVVPPAVLEDPLPSSLSFVPLKKSASFVHLYPNLSTAACTENISQNDRMVWVWRGLKGHPIPIPCHGQGQFSLHQVAESIWVVPPPSVKLDLPVWHPMFLKCSFQLLTMWMEVQYLANESLILFWQGWTEEHQLLYSG